MEWYALHERKFIINPFDIADKSPANRELVAQEITDLVAELVEDSGLSRLMTTIIFPIVYTLLRLDYSDFSMLVDCINPNAGQDRIKSLSKLVESHHKAIWAGLEGKTYDTSKQSIFNRLQSLMNYQLVVNTLCGRDDFGAMIEGVAGDTVAGQRVAVSLPIPTIGDTVAVTLGRFFMCRMQIFAKSRQTTHKSKREPIVLIIDEFHNFISHALADTLDQFGRKFGVFLMLAHQHIKQITDSEIKGSVLANTKNKIAGMSNRETRQAVAHEMTGINPEQLEGLRAGHFVARLTSAETVVFYSRMVKYSPSLYTYATTKNTAEIPNGWDGTDTEQNIPTAEFNLKPAGRKKAKKPQYED